jgi:phosphoglycolate phosphatase
MLAAMNPRAICFDLDGTLLDTLTDLATSMNAALAKLGLPPHPEQAYKTFVGDGMETLARRVLPAERRGDDQLAAACVAGMRAEYAQRWADATKPYAGVPELLDGLVDRDITLTILSNKPDDFTVEAVAKLLDRWPFAIVRGVRPGVPPKPDPAGLFALLDELGIPNKREWLYVGDTNTDMRTAAAAGLTSVGVLWGFRERAELEAEGAQHLIDEPRQLLSLLG